jgi:hypothetical protein
LKHLVQFKPGQSQSSASVGRGSAEPRADKGKAKC